jgi:N-acetylneuraminate synthase
LLGLRKQEVDMIDASGDHIYIVAEIGINHNGDLERAIKLISAAHYCGVDAVKFQKRTIEVVYTKEDLDRPRTSPFGTTNRDLKWALEFGEGDYDTIDKHCKDLGIDWFASPWDEASVEFLSRYDIPYLNVVVYVLYWYPLPCAIWKWLRSLLIGYIKMVER